MSKADVQQALYDFILRQFPAARKRGLNMTDSLLEQGIVDSMGVLEIVTFVEQQFAIALTDDEMVADYFDSIPALAELVYDKLTSEKACSS